MDENRLLEIGLKKKRKEISKSWDELARETNFPNGEAFRLWVKNRLRRKQQKPQANNVSEIKELVEIHSDGSQSSHRLLWMTFEESKDPEYLLKAHGYSVDAWELVSARSNIWNAYSKQDGIQTLYSSRITVKPKVTVYSWEKLLERFSSVPSVTIQRPAEKKSGYLNLPLFDMHFGINDFDYYRDTQSDIAELINRGYKEVLFIIGQDLLHNDDFRGRTAKGTTIEKIDMEKAWEDAMLFYLPLIDLALEKCNCVTVIYSKGNHDESMSWAFVKCLEARYPQATFDTRFRERKVHMLGKNFIGINHGDKKRVDNLTENFSTEFPLEWSQATTREIFTGHLHHERVLDKGGAVIRRMPTGNDVDDYHNDYGFTTAHKRFEVFEYSEDKVLRIHYV